MDPEFWLGRWQEGRIGFHEGRTNTFLERHLDLFAPGSGILVPLCGKAHDLAFLAERGHRVLGVELSPLAVEAFFREHDLEPARRAFGAFELWEARGVAILLGDFFALDAAAIAPFSISALYDRAALIALPPEMHQRYAAHLRTLMPAGARGLVITMEYPPEQMTGPPFSVMESDVRALFPGLPLEQIDSAMAVAPRLHDLGVDAIERVFTLAF